MMMDSEINEFRQQNDEGGVQVDMTLKFKGLIFYFIAKHMQRNRKQNRIK